jgi:hypothetical protein
MGLSEVSDGDTLAARERRNQDIHAILLDQLTDRANGGIWARIGGGDKIINFLTSRPVREFLQCHLEPTHTVFAESRVGAFERCGDANLELFCTC